jgi:MFS family permease
MYFFKIHFYLGIWLSAFSLGNFVGPTIAGVLVQTQGFRATTMVFFVLYAVMIVIDLMEAVRTSRRGRIQSQYENLE